MQNSVNINNSQENNTKQQNEVLINAKKIINGETKNFTPQMFLDMQILNENKVCIVKKDGTLEKFNIQKIINAISKSAERMLVKFNESELTQICNLVKEQILILIVNLIFKTIKFMI